MFKKTIPVAVIIASALLLGGCSPSSAPKAGAESTSKASSSSAPAETPESMESAPATSPEGEASEAPASPADETPLSPEAEATLSEADQNACAKFTEGITALYSYEPTSETDFTSVDQFVAFTDEAKVTEGVSPELSASFAKVSETAIIFKDLLIKNAAETESGVETVTEDELTVAGENFSVATDAVRACGTF